MRKLRNDRLNRRADLMSNAINQACFFPWICSIISSHGNTVRAESTFRWVKWAYFTYLLKPSSAKYAPQVGPSNTYAEDEAHKSKSWSGHLYNRALKVQRPGEGRATGRLNTSRFWSPDVWPQMSPVGETTWAYLQQNVNAMNNSGVNCIPQESHQAHVEANVWGGR